MQRLTRAAIALFPIVALVSAMSSPATSGESVTRILPVRLGAHVLRPHAPFNRNASRFRKDAHGVLHAPPQYALPGGALVEVSQGATVGIGWYCADDSAGDPCPANWVSVWYGLGSNGLSVSLSTSVTSGGGQTQEYFTASQSDKPGLYPGGICESLVGDPYGPVCAYFLVYVEPAPDAPLPMPPKLPGESIKLEMAGAKAGPFQLANFGHFYIELFIDGVAQLGVWPYQAGPDGSQVSFLSIQRYSQAEYDDPQVDITPYVTIQALTTYYNAYLAHQDELTAPEYQPTVLNSNTWIDGMLLRAGISQATITSWILRLKKPPSLLDPVAYEYGSHVEPCFYPPKAAAMTPFLLRPDIIFLGCATQP